MPRWPGLRPSHQRPRAMLQGVDNVVSNTDAVDTFKLPLVGLEEQIRRSF